ncbi:MAG: alginate lyase family protein, partial [Lentisphaeria bacterium]|nr:alginate lyase family protein [Lentisphaeria bacterium]
PEWIVTVSADERGASWKDQPGGRCRGWLLIGRPVRLPRPAPVQMGIRFDYKTFCELDTPRARSGMFDAFIMSRKAWDLLAREPAAAQTINLSRLHPDVLTVRVKGQGADQIEWADSGLLTFPRLTGTMRDETELVVGVAWGAYHFTPEWGAFRKLEVTMLTEKDLERRFWRALDLDRAELSQVRAAIDGHDRAAAVAALARHFRKRKTPVVADPLAAASDSWLLRADETLQHTYRIAGCLPYTFKGPIIWNLDPFNYNQWPVQLNRHVEWRFLAAAHLRTRDDKYAREWASQVRHWVASMPVMIAPNWIQGPFNLSGRTSLSLDAGIRLGQTWFPSFEVFRNSPAVSDQTIVTFLRSCLDHGNYLMKEINFRKGSNWGAMECNGLFHLGVMLPEFRDAPTWRETALQRITAELDNQVYPDGAQHELAPGYHGVSLKNFLDVMRLARVNDIALPEQYVTKLERMFDCYLRVAAPDFRMPALNDSGRGSITGYLRQGSELFPEREDFRWVATGRRDGAPPSYTCTAMPYAGWVAMRSDWSPTSRYLLFDAGPFGTGHQHEDKLGITLFAFGRELIAEAGVYAYDTSPWRRYVLSTRAHNTVRIDGKDQNCRRTRSEFLATEPDTHGFFDDEAFCYARDTHTAGYGNPSDRTVQHRRRVLFVKPDYWVVVDDFLASDDADHVAESQFLLNAEDGALSETLVGTSADEDGGRVAVLPLVRDGLTARIAKGETEPEVRGFIPRGFNKLRPAPALLYSIRFRGRGQMAFALVPFKGALCPLKLVAETDSAGDMRSVVIKSDMGAETRLHIGPNTLQCLAKGRVFAAEEPATTTSREVSPP